MADKRIIDYETPPTKKGAKDLPWWLEGLLVVGMVALAVVESMHGQWVWAGIFGIAGALFGASLAVRLGTGGRHGK